MHVCTCARTGGSRITKCLDDSGSTKTPQTSLEPASSTSLCRMSHHPSHIAVAEAEQPNDRRLGTTNTPDTHGSIKESNGNWSVQLPQVGKRLRGTTVTEGSRILAQKQQRTVWSCSDVPFGPSIEIVQENRSSAADFLSSVSNICKAAEKLEIQLFEQIYFN